MKIGYARVSTENQNLDRQLDQLKNENCERIYQEKIAGNDKERPELERLLDNLRLGDTIIITELTRLSRSTRDLFKLVDKIERKGSNIKSLKEIWVDTTTPQGKFMFTVIAGLTQFERDLIVQRTKEGLESARARGRKGGRPKKNKNDIEKALKLYKSKEYSLKEIREHTGVSKTSLYRYLEEYKNVDLKFDDIKKEKVAEIKLWLRVENNNKFVRGRKRTIESIERYLDFYDMKKPKNYRQNGDYLLYVKYTTIDGLKEKVYEILQELELEADMRNCFTESDAVCDELKISW
ncbi:recombinase family protein [Candidatus Woesearchaeota archaeon]|nr:recombinase family protein [Candidatus Woesearchaeota archaeon]